MPDPTPPPPALPLPGALAEPHRPPLDVNARLEPADVRPPFDRGPIPLWIAIRNRRLDYSAYARFVNLALCQGAPPDPTEPAAAYFDGVMKRLRPPIDGARHDCFKLGWLGHGMSAYELLKTATEAFLILECGVFVASYADPDPKTLVTPGIEEDRVTAGKLPLTPQSVRAALSTYLGGNVRLSYIDHIVKATFGDLPNLFKDRPFCEGVLAARTDCPCFLELIWSYWHEEGMLVQSLNALSLRFQNRRRGGGRDPLAQLELSPLRPLSSIFWGYVQDEQHRLSLARRNHEYEHEYGIGLRGKAVPAALSADRRSKFIEALHDLLYRCAQYYQQSANLQFNPDPFPLLNGLKEVHLILSQGAGNQFGDLPWTARVEMLMQQWILARPEIREFLGRRPMVSYPEEWMANADALKSMMGWSDTSIIHFRNLAVFGEQLLLSIRWHAWSGESSAIAARDWASYFRPEIQGYLHAYRVATGIDLTAEPKDQAAIADRREPPSALLERRLNEQRQRGAQ
jgi:hypothetical protein